MDGKVEDFKMTDEVCERLRLFVERALGEREMAETARLVVSNEECQEYVQFYADFLVAPAEGEAEAEKAQIRDIADKAMDRALEKLAQRRHDLVPPPGVWEEIVESFRRKAPVSLAAADGQGANQMQAAAAADAGFVYFYSRGREDDSSPHGWQARLTKPPSHGTTGKYRVQFRIENPDGTPVANGKLILCGVEFDIRDGRALIPKEEFIRVSGNGVIGIRWPDGEVVNGAMKI